MQCDEFRHLLLNKQTGIKLGSAVVITGLISYLKFRPIAIVVSSIYVTWIYRTFYPHYNIQVPKELRNKCNSLYENLRELREKRPNVFCGFITSILFLLAVIGHVVNGTYILLACLIAGVFLTSKYEIKIIKDEKHLSPSSSSSCNNGGDGVDEFCPRMDEVNMMILKQIGDHADDTGIYSTSSNKTTAATISNDSDSDNDYNDLLPKNAVIPEPDDIDAAASSFNTFDDGEEFLSSNINNGENNLVLTQSAEYKRKHFSNSESSDSDDSITRGLDFKNIPVTATIEPHTSPAHINLLTSIQDTIARNLIENIVRPSPPSAATKSSQGFESDDDSDFEILDSDDFPK